MLRKIMRGSTMKEYGIHILTLRFLKEAFERDFRSDYFQKSLRHVRFALSFGLFLYAIFGILDEYIIPEAKATSWFIRYAIVCPYCAFLFLFSFSPRFERLMQEAIALLVFAAGVGIVVMVLLADQPGARLYSGGLLLVYMFSYAFLKMRFVHAAFASWASVVVYEIAALWTGRVSFPVFLTCNFFYISANLVGMFTAYHLEFYARRDFLHTRMVKEQEEKKYLMEKEKSRIEDEKHFQQEREKILKDLHDGIGGATMNVTLLAELALRETSLPAIRKNLSTIAELGRENLAEIQRFLNTLDSARTNWHTMTADMRDFGSTMIESHGMSFDLEASAEDMNEAVDSALSLSIFRIYKEALSNALKHSKAKAVTVTLTAAKGRLALTIRDDGVGLGGKKETGRGLQNMRARAEEMGGSLAVTSERGTCVRLEIPLRQKYAGRSIEGP